MSAESTPERNVELLQQTLALIESKPSEWNQSAYRCGTSCCFAGWAAVLDGGKWANESNPDDDALVAVDDDVDTFPHHVTKVPVVYSHERASRVLGLDVYEADVLFDGGNSIHDLRAYVGALVAGKPIVDEDGYPVMLDELDEVTA